MVTRARLCYVSTYIALNASPISPLQPQEASLSALFWSRISSFFHQWAGRTHDTLPNCDLLLQFFEAVLCFRSSVVQIVEKFYSHYGTPAGYAVAQLVEALRFKSEGRVFDSRWCHWNFSLTSSGRAMALGLTQPLTEMSTRNITWGVKAAGA